MYIFFSSFFFFFPIQSDVLSFLFFSFSISFLSISSDYALKESQARCLPNTAASVPGEVNETPLGSYNTVFKCVQECTIVQGCRYVGYDKENKNCWMIKTSSMSTCMAGDLAASHVFNRAPEHNTVHQYQVFTDGRKIISLDSVSNQLQTSCRGTEFISKAVSNKAYALCCGDRKNF